MGGGFRILKKQYFRHNSGIASARKATRTGLGDASVQRPNTEAKKLQEQVYGMTQIFVGCSAFALNGNSVSLNDDEDSVHLIMMFSWFQDGQISYEEFEGI
ncbi:hypothetical protein Tco_0185556 [Tanacetum coccineum]